MMSIIASADAVATGNEQIDLSIRAGRGWAVLLTGIVNNTTI
jgi:hypothetical protein